MTDPTQQHEGEEALRNLANLVEQARRGAYNGKDDRPSAALLRNQALRFYRGASFDAPAATAASTAIATPAETAAVTAARGRAPRKEGA
jgi:hypothetical protein